MLEDFSLLMHTSNFVSPTLYVASFFLLLMYSDRKLLDSKCPSGCLEGNQYAGQKVDPVKHRDVGLIGSDTTRIITTTTSAAAAAATTATVTTPTTPLMNEVHNSGMGDGKDHRSGGKMIDPKQHPTFPLDAPELNEDRAEDVLQELQIGLWNELTMLGSDVPKDTILEGMKNFETYLNTSVSLRKSWNEAFSVDRPRGIVIAAGRKTAIFNAAVTLEILKNRIGCTLPVVIAYYGEEEMSTGTRKYFAESFSSGDGSDLQFMDMKKLEYPIHHAPLNIGYDAKRDFGYKLKVYALYKAPFREILYMDADAIPMQDPSTLFEYDGYKKNGNVFWNDFWKEPIHLWDALNISHLSPWNGKVEEMNYDATLGDLKSQEDSLLEWAGVISRPALVIHDPHVPFNTESGFMVIDRHQHWKAMEWSYFISSIAPYTYSFMIGDKDSYRAAFELAGSGAEYHQIEFGPSLPLTKLEDTSHVDYRNIGMLQLHPADGSPLFHHRTAGSKFIPGEDQREARRPITHVTPPVNTKQSSVMMYGDPSYSLTRVGPNILWGLRRKNVKVSPCSSIPVSPVHSVPSLRATEGQREAAAESSAKKECPCPPTIHLHTAYQRCTGRTDEDLDDDPEPILLIEVPQDSFIHETSHAELDVLHTIPFQEVW